MTKEMLDKLIEQERWEAFDSTHPGYHNELLKALVELKNIQESCEDCISREAVLAMSDYIRETPTYDDPLGKVEEVVRVKDIKALPPVVPKRKKGKWIVEVWNGREHHTCSNCLHVVDYEPCYHYCPVCGAEMESDEI